MKQNKRGILLAGASLVVPLLAHAGDGLAFDLSTGGGYSDNVTRSSSNEQDETIAMLGLRMSYDEQGSRFNARVASDLAYYDYLQNTYDSELIGTFLGTADVDLIEDRLNLFVDDSFGQVLGDPFVPSTPDNRDNINYLATGLDGKFAFGSRTRLDLKLTYALAMYQDLPLDSDTGIGEISFMRLVSDASSLGFDLRGAQVRYDDAVNSANDYDVREAALQYRLHGARTRVDLDAGYTQLDRDDGSRDDGPLFRLKVARALSSRSTLTFDAGQEFANSAEAFQAHSAGGAAGLDSYAGRQTAAPFTRRYAGLGWDASGVRTRVTVDASWDEQDYGVQSLANESLGSISASVARDLNAALNARLRAEWGKGNYQAQGGDYTESRLGMELRWQFTRRMALALTYDHEKRASESNSNRYQENRFWLTVGYQQGSPRDSIAAPEFSSDEGR